MISRYKDTGSHLKRPCNKTIHFSKNVTIRLYVHLTFFFLHVIYLKKSPLCRHPNDLGLVLGTAILNMMSAPPADSESLKKQSIIFPYFFSIVRVLTNCCFFEYVFSLLITDEKSVNKPLHYCNFECVWLLGELVHLVRRTLLCKSFVACG